MPTTPIDDKIYDLFSVDVRYRIPIYQRRYVWDEDNWKTLWKDIKENADKNSIGDSQVHFIGTIVTRETQETGKVIYEVIDGQQRLTTLQIIFCALKFLCNQMDDDSDIAVELNDLLRLDLALGGHHKVIPTEYDQDAFNAVIGNDVHVPPTIAEHKIYRSYVYFYNEFAAYVGEDYDKLHNLYGSIVNNLCVVQIELETDHRFQKIFETLNATGRRLSEFDYLRNNLFLRVGNDNQSEQEKTRLYRAHWTEFETHYNEWSDDKLESFLQDFLSAKLGTSKQEDTKSFDRYRQYSENLGPNRDLEYEIEQLKTYGIVYRRMNNSDDEIGRYMQFYEDLDIAENVRPFILYVISELRPNPDQTKQFFQILESYIIQSRLVGSSNNLYRRIENFFNLIRSREHTFLNVDLFRTYLHWPSKQQIEEALRNAGTKNGKLIRYILYNIECRKRESMSEADIPTEKLSFEVLQSLEHLMPTSWRDYWPLEDAGQASLYFSDLYDRRYKNSDSRWLNQPVISGLASNNKRYRAAHKLAVDRIKVTQSIGNLTPLTIKLNKNFSYKSFSDKRKFFLDNPAGANLVLTREIFYQNEKWDVPEIRERETNLFKEFFNIWPVVTQS